MCVRTLSIQTSTDMQGSTDKRTLKPLKWTDKIGSFLEKKGQVHFAWFTSL